MLFSINGKLIKKTPHMKQRRRLLYLLSSEDFEFVRTEVESRIYSDTIGVSDLIPPNWNDSVFKPLYGVAESDNVKTAQFLGIILWEVMMAHEGKWVFKDLYNLGIQSVSYFRKETA